MDSIDSDDSNPNRFEIHVHRRPIALPSPLTRKRDEDEEEDVSDKEAKLIRRKRVKRAPIASPAPTLDSSSPSASKIAWTKNDELLILMGIVAYEDETKSSYRSDWDAIYGSIKSSIEANFSKEQLRRKIRKLKKRFTDKSGDGGGPSSVNTPDDEIFKLSMAIWGKRNETACASNVNTDVTDAEHGQITHNVEQGKEHEQQIIEDVEQAEDMTNADHEQITEDLQQAEDHVTNADPEQISEMVEQGKDLSNAEQVQITEHVEQAEDHVTNAEHDQSTANVGVEEYCVLQGALEAMVFPTLGEVHKKLLLQNMRNLEAEKGKELSEEWKALVVEEMKLQIKKLTYSAKLTEASA